MPDLVLNCSFVSRTTGTDDPIFSTVTGKNRDPRDALTDGQEVFYYRRYKGSKSGFENAIGCWRSATNSIERTSIESSSAENGTDPVSWGSSPQVVDVSFEPGMIVADDDPRLDTVGIDELDEGATPDGTEIAHFLQGGDGVSLTAQQIAGTALTAQRGHAKNYVTGYTAFTHTRHLMSITADSTLCDSEPWFTLLSGAGARVMQTSWLGGAHAFYISTGTTTTGRCAIVNTQYYNPFDSALAMETIFSLGVTAQPSVEAYTAQVGYIKGLPSLATDGMYFQLSAASANLRAIVRVAGVETNIDTGIVATGAIVGRIYYDPDELETRFYLDGVLVATIPNATRVITDATNLQMAYSIIKSAGTTSVSLASQGHFYKNFTAALPAGW